MSDLKNIIEAILFVSGEMISIKDISQGLQIDKSEIKKQLAILSDEYDSKDSGMKIVWINECVQMSSREKYASSIENVLAPLKVASLTRSAIETLSIVAYKQPITRSEVAEIRGVRSDYSINILRHRGLIEEAGEKDTLGNPMMFKTTELFLREFNMNSLENLPSIDDIKDLNL